MASPLGNEGCGLKLQQGCGIPEGRTASPLGNEGCGLKQAPDDGPAINHERFTPRQRGVWIETFHHCVKRNRIGMASPLGNEGCGLKPDARGNEAIHHALHPSATRGVD